VNRPDKKGIPIAKEGYPFFLPLLLLGVFFIYQGFLISGWIFLLLGGFVVFFFRDPFRKIPQGDELVLSPADGRIVKIGPAPAEEFPGWTQISIFLSIFNVHINRTPIPGVVETRRYNPGKFLAAFNHKASLLNEQNLIIIDSESGKVAVKQIAGLIARRIVCWVGEQDRLEKGRRIGLIRFGSRVDVLFPEKEVAILVKEGERVKGGLSILGRLQHKDKSP
jgi:phosphatidylserine decarboxylase